MYAKISYTIPNTKIVSDTCFFGALYHYRPSSQGWSIPVNVMDVLKPIIWEPRG